MSRLLAQGNQAAAQHTGAAAHTGEIAADQCNRVSIPSCTPEQKAALRILHAAEFGQRGRSSSVGTKDRVISALEHELQPGSPCKKAKMSYDATVKHVAAREHISPLKIRLWHKLAASGEELEDAPVQRITRADRRHMLYSTLGPRLEVKKFIFEWIAAAREEGTYTSVSLLRAELKQQMQIELPRETLRRWLHGMQIDYGKRKLSPLSIAYTNCLIRRYLVEYAQLLRLEQANEIVLVWMDESYIHAGYCAARGWFLNSDKRAPVKGRVRGTAKAERIIIIHAMTRLGMLEVPIDEEDVSDCLRR